MSANPKQRPFSKSYVMRLTLKYVIRSIEMSLAKTFERVEEFANDREKSTEVLETLSALHAFKRLIEDFKEHNKHIFEDK